MLISFDVWMGLFILALAFVAGLIIGGMVFRPRSVGYRCPEY